MDYIVLSRPELASSQDASLQSPLKIHETRCYANFVNTHGRTQNVDSNVKTNESCNDEYDENSVNQETKSSLQASDRKFDYLIDVLRSREECREEYQAPQRSEKWHNARKYTLTASNFGSAAGHNKYCTPEECAIEKVKNEFCGNEATQYGTLHEPHARDFLLKLLSQELYETLKDQYFQDTSGILSTYELQECGIMKHSDQSWMGASPDGIIKLDGDKGPTWILVEYKCPFSKKDSSDHPYKFYKNMIPDYYYDQIQGIMGYLQKFKDSEQYRKINSCLFVVWQPNQMHVTKFAYDAQYYIELERLLKNWYFDLYLPMLLKK
jgi:hypothetical protein